MHQNQARKGTLATSAYDQLRQEIITGTIAPGARLVLRSICGRFDVGLSPVREALSRLSSEGLVSQIDHRGFAVTPLSEVDLDSLVNARCWLNEVAVRESIARGDAAWEEHVLVSFHRLLRTPRNQSETVAHRNPAWEEAHAVFHGALVSACGSTWMVSFCHQLFEAAERYRNVARLAGAVRGANEEAHRQIMEATLERDAQRAAKLLSEHYLETAELVRAVLARSPDHWGRSTAR